MENVQTAANGSRQGTDLLTVLEQFGLASLTSKLFVGALFLSAALAAAAGFGISFLSEGPGTRFLLLFGAFSLIAVAWSFFVASALRSRTGALQAAMDGLKAGKNDVRLDSESRDEFGQLAGAFNHLAHQAAKVQSAKARDIQALLNFQKALECSDEAVAVIDSRGDAKFYNKKLTQMFECGAEELERIGGASALHQKPSVAAEISEAARRGATWSGEVQMKTRGGRVVPVSLRVDSLADASGKPIGRVEFYTDLTERKQKEAVQSALNRIADIANSATDLNSFYAAIHRTVGEIMYAGNLFLATYEPATEM